MSLPEIPSRRMPATAGREYPGLICKGCSTGIAMAGDVPALPPTFSVTCPRCGKKETYRKDEIQTLLAHRKQ